MWFVSLRAGGPTARQLPAVCYYELIAIIKKTATDWGFELNFLNKKVYEFPSPRCHSHV